jgi:peptidoglycan/xylan/chitin deacetylase (PgdA/CDA1 family)
VVLLFFLIGAGVLALAHTAPFPFLLEYVGPDRSLWHMPAADGRPTIYLTYDDGPNPKATPALLDVLRASGATATFFVIPNHVTADTAPIVARAVREGHGVAMHSDTRALMLLSPEQLAERLDADARRIRALSGSEPCRVFRPHAGWRGGAMYEGLAEADYKLAGWSFGMWDWDWWRPSQPEKLASRLAAKASDGDIIVMHDGHHKNARADRTRTVEATGQLVPLLEARGFAFGHLCPATALSDRPLTGAAPAVAPDVSYESRTPRAVARN